ncbi:hypothetical protein [Modicisalibacter luteus]|jgi:hypothetical protein|uniref:Uncharacterized protein n=1 Tax=Modicisalibacter luteus TaxID=453962 RepID=A0ABV7LZ39_9GAMM|nr:hypothetical protein [Halomonas lutea]GHB02172.1 hypothetical protein GCM10007159_25070 [Halomonas lutea]
MDRSLTINEAVDYARKTFAPYPVATLIDEKDEVEVTVQVDGYAVRVAHLDSGSTPTREAYLDAIRNVRTRMRGIGARFEDSEPHQDSR